VVERLRVIDNGNTLEVAFTVDDPAPSINPGRERGTAIAWSMRTIASMRLPAPKANDDYFGIGLEPVPVAEKPEF